jgi:hypothetical protein
VLHAATGFVNLMAAVVEVDTCAILFCGPVTPYYDVTTVGNDPVRLTIEEWRKTLLKDGGAAHQPPWIAPVWYTGGTRTLVGPPSF